MLPLPRLLSPAAPGAVARCRGRSLTRSAVEVGGVRLGMCDHATARDDSARLSACQPVAGDERGPAWIRAALAVVEIEHRDGDRKARPPGTLGLDDGCPEGEELDDVASPAVAFLRERHADDASRAEVLRLGLHALHRELTRVVERLGEVGKLDVAPGLGSG